MTAELGMKDNMFIKHLTEGGDGCWGASVTCTSSVSLISPSDEGTVPLVFSFCAPPFAFIRTLSGNATGTAPIVVHTGPKANTNKTQTSRFTWFPKIGYVHGGSRLYIIGGIIQTLQPNPNTIPEPSVSLNTRCFSQICIFFTLTVALTCTLFFSALDTLPLLHCILFCTLFIREMEALGSSSPCEEPTTTMTKVMVVVDGWWRKVDNCYMIIVI